MCVYKTRSGSYASAIQTDGVRTHLGTFKTADEAAQAYLDAKRLFHKTCSI